MMKNVYKADAIAGIQKRTQSLRQACPDETNAKAGGETGGR